MVRSKRTKQAKRAAKRGNKVDKVDIMNKTMSVLAATIVYLNAYYLQTTPTKTSETYRVIVTISNPIMWVCPQSTPNTHKTVPS